MLLSGGEIRQICWQRMLNLAIFHSPFQLVANSLQKSKTFILKPGLANAEERKQNYKLRKYHKNQKHSIAVESRFFVRHCSEFESFVDEIAVSFSKILILSEMIENVSCKMLFHVSIFS